MNAPIEPSNVVLSVGHPHLQAKRGYDQHHQYFMHAFNDLLVGCLEAVCPQLLDARPAAAPAWMWGTLILKQNVYSGEAAECLI